MGIKGVLFDKDGTIFGFNDTWADWSTSFLKSLAPHDIPLRHKMADLIGFDLDKQEFRVGSLVVNGAVDEQTELLAGVHPTLSAKEIEKIAFDALNDTTAQPVCDLDELFGGLRNRGLSLGIATNDFERSAINQMKQVNADHYFDFFCGYDSGYGAKPAAGMILGFCEKMGLKPTQIAMVGDSTHDLEAGRNAGVGINIGVLTGPAKHQDIAHLADEIIDDISHLKTVLTI